MNEHENKQQVQIFKKHAKSYASALAELPKKDPDYSKLSETLKEAQAEKQFLRPHDHKENSVWTRDAAAHGQQIGVARSFLDGHHCF